MNYFLYAMIFIAGTVFGSFFSLAVYRIPRKENITYVQSHCTSCNHKLYFWDLIPIFSYLFLGGKCRYCKEKIRPRYILLEIFSGLTFLLVALSLKIGITSSLAELIGLFLIYLWIAGLFLVGGIDKENFYVIDSLIIYLVVVGCAKLLYLGILQEEVVENLLGFLCVPFVLWLVDLCFKALNQNPIGFGDIEFLAVIGLFLGIKMQLIAIVISLLVAGVGVFIHHYHEIPWGYYLSIGSILAILLCESDIMTALLL